MEISGHQALSAAELAGFGQALAETLGQVAPGLAWGLQFLDENSSPLPAAVAFFELLNALARRGAAPQFIAHFISLI